MPLDLLTVHSKPTVATAWLAWLRTTLNSANGLDMSVDEAKFLFALCSGVLSYTMKRVLTLYRGYLATLYRRYLITLYRRYLDKL